MPRARILPVVAALAIHSLIASCSSDCTNVAANVSAVCLPDVLAEGQVAVVDAREACGVNCARAPRCEAVLTNGTLLLTLREDECPNLYPGCEFAPCAQRVATCRLPALAAGDYPVVVPGSPGRVLHVRAAGGVSACRLPAP
ncbi:MAG: hypothetical protein NVSMB23_20940 [Myxococcales bacterium]